MKLFHSCCWMWMSQLRVMHISSSLVSLSLSLSLSLSFSRFHKVSHFNFSLFFSLFFYVILSCANSNSHLPAHSPPENSFGIFTASFEMVFRLVLFVCTLQKYICADFIIPPLIWSNLKGCARSLSLFISLDSIRCGWCWDVCVSSRMIIYHPSTNNSHIYIYSMRGGIKTLQEMIKFVFLSNRSKI